MPEAIAFGPFRLDGTSGRLSRDGRDVEIQPRPLALLRHLASRPGELVTRAELLASVWGGIRVDPGVVKVAMHALREALGDDGGAPRWIETVGRRGYRFVDDAAGEPRRPVRAPAPPFVGRGAEMTALQAAFARACGGQRQTVVVTGEAGIGKTALVDRFLSDVAPRARVARGQCQEHYGAGEAYLPMHDALRALCAGADGGEAKAILRRCAPSWLAQQPSLTSETERATLQRISHGASQERLLRELAEAIEVLAATRPLLLVLEDLHWSDASTVELLVRLTQRRDDAQLLLVGTHRSGDPALVDHPWRDAARELVAKRLAVEVPLELLAEEEVVSYVAPCVAVGEAAGLGRAVHERTGGNPLFMVHVVDELWSVGLATCDDGAWRLRADADVIARRIPDALRGLLETHLDRLTAEHRAVLEAASVAGQVFAAAAVAAALGEPSEDVDEICEDVASAAAALIEPVGLAEWPDGTVSGRYRFRHALYADALRDRIAPTRRGRLHRLIGERLEAGLGERAHEHAAMLAAHFEAARQLDRAERWHDRAGESALRQSAHGVALGHFQQALELLGPRPDRRRALALHTKIGMAFAASRGYAAPEAEAAFARAVAFSEGIAESAELFHAYRGLREFFQVRGEIARARTFAEHLMRLARANDAPSFAIEAEFSMGSVCFYAGELEAARARFGRALSAATGVGAAAARVDVETGTLHTHDPVATTLSELALTLWLLGFPEDARARSAAAVDLAESSLPPLGRAHAFSFDAVLHQALGDVATARVRTAAVRGLAVEHGFPHWLAMSMLLDGWSAARAGDPGAGAELLQAGIAATEAIGAQLGLPYWRVGLAQALGASGRVDEALVLVAGELQRIERSGERTHVSALHRTRGELLVARGAAGEAEAAFERALAIARRGGLRAYALPAAVALARLWEKTERARAGRALVAEEAAAFGAATTPDLAVARALLAAGD